MCTPHMCRCDWAAGVARQHETGEKCNQGKAGREKGLINRELGEVREKNNLMDARLKTRERATESRRVRAEKSKGQQKKARQC